MVEQELFDRLCDGLRNLAGTYRNVFGYFEDNQVSHTANSLTVIVPSLYPMLLLSSSIDGRLASRVAAPPHAVAVRHPISPGLGRWEAGTLQQLSSNVSTLCEMSW